MDNFNWRLETMFKLQQFSWIFHLIELLQFTRLLKTTTADRQLLLFILNCTPTCERHPPFPRIPIFRNRLREKRGHRAHHKAGSGKEKTGPVVRHPRRAFACYRTFASNFAYNTPYSLRVMVVKTNMDFLWSNIQT